MKQIRWWNSFNLLGVLLLAVAFLGGISGGKFIYDPGRVQKGHEWVLYLIAGALMLVNGMLSPATVPAAKSGSKDKK